MPILSRLKHILIDSNTDFYELYIALQTFVWGIVMFVPIHSTLGVQNRLILTLIARQEVFAIVAVLLGVLYIIDMLFLDYVPKLSGLIILPLSNPITLQRFIRLAINLLVTAFWIFVTSIYLINNPTSTSTISYGMLSIFSAFTYLRQ